MYTSVSVGYARPIKPDDTPSPVQYDSCTTAKVALVAVILATVMVSQAGLPMAYEPSPCEGEWHVSAWPETVPYVDLRMTR